MECVTSLECLSLLSVYSTDRNKMDKHSTMKVLMFCLLSFLSACFDSTNIVSCYQMKYLEQSVNKEIFASVTVGPSSEQKDLLQNECTMLVTTSKYKINI